MSQASIESQVAMIKKRLDVADFQDPAKVEKFVARFAAMYDVDNGSANVSSPALTILGGGSTTVGTDTGLLAEPAAPGPISRRYSTTTVSRIEGWMPQKASKVPRVGKRIVTASCGSWAPELKSKRGS